MIQVNYTVNILEKTIAIKSFNLCVMVSSWVITELSYHGNWRYSSYCSDHELDHNGQTDPLSE